MVATYLPHVEDMFRHSTNMIACVHALCVCNMYIYTWSLHDPLNMSSLPKIKGSWTHFLRVMETPGIYWHVLDPSLAV